MVQPANLGNLSENFVRGVAQYQGADPQLAETLGRIGNVAGQGMQQALNQIPPGAQAPVATGMGLGGIVAAGLAAGPAGLIIVGVGAIFGAAFAGAMGRLDH